MRTAGSNYKMSKLIKTGLALGRFRTREDRNSWKRSMIQAEVIATIPVRQPRAENKNNT